jgi:hypothetical protein
MGGLNKTDGSSAHNAALLAAEAAWQSAVAGVASTAAGQVVMNAAELAFHRAVVASCKANNNNQGLEASLAALRSLGVNS